MDSLGRGLAALLKGNPSCLLLGTPNPPTPAASSGDGVMQTDGKGGTVVRLCDRPLVDEAMAVGDGSQQPSLLTPAIQGRLRDSIDSLRSLFSINHDCRNVVWLDRLFRMTSKFKALRNNPTTRKLPSIVE